MLSSEVVATYDIFATALALAGVPLPTDRVIDGQDLSEVCFCLCEVEVLVENSCV